MLTLKKRICLFFIQRKHHEPLYFLSHVLFWTIDGCHDSLQALETSHSDTTFIQGKKLIAHVQDHVQAQHIMAQKANQLHHVHMKTRCGY